jgi:hypothetical protein
MSKKIIKKLLKIVIIASSIVFFSWFMYIGAHFDDDKICTGQNGEWNGSECLLK